MKKYSCRLYPPLRIGLTMYPGRSWAKATTDSSYERGPSGGKFINILGHGQAPRSPL